MSIYNSVSGGGGSGYSIVELSSNVNSISLTPSQTTGDFTITYDGDGTLTVTSNDTSVATVALVSGKTYRVTGTGNGSAKITVKASVGTTTIPANKVVINVSSNVVSNTLNDNSWDIISSVAQAGTAASYWSIGDCKAVTLNGTIGGNLTLSNTTLYVYILGFNHNEATGIDFGGFKTALSGGVDVALVDSGYNNTQNFGVWFNMNNSSSNSGGWKSCRMRYYVLGSTDSSSGNDASSTTATSPVSNTLMAALPSALRVVMRPMTVYSDNTGGGSDTASYVTATVDYLPLLAEYEVFGTRSSANSAEKNNQAQYQYYINGNSKVKYKHDATSTTCLWWLRSVFAAGTYFCTVNEGGAADYYGVDISRGVAPAFRI